MDVSEIREMFPAIRDFKGCYLDNAATTQKPECVLEGMEDYYRKRNANVHRAGYRAAMESTVTYEKARKAAARFINCSPDEVIFTGGTTMSVNFAALGYAWDKLGPGKNIVATAAEHNSNLFPYREICRRRGASLRIVPLRDGRVDARAAGELITEDTVLTACCMDSNLLDSRMPVEIMVETAHKHSCPVLLDAAQAAGHRRIDCQKLETDFLCFSGHKMYGPMGIGVLYASRRMQERMNPVFTGGGMAEETEDGISWLDGPAGFEAGTPNVAGAAGLERAIRFLEEMGMDEVEAYERRLKHFARERFTRSGKFILLGDGDAGTPLLSFYSKELQSYDMAVLLGMKEICVRSGKHCAYETLRQLGISGCVRASFAVYNTLEEIEMLAEQAEWAVQRYGR